MIRHLIAITAITALLAALILYPFLPGDYDSLAMPLSTMAQASGMLGLVLVPSGALWLGYELLKQSRQRRKLSIKPWRYFFALVSSIVSLIVGLIVCLVAFATVGLPFAVITAVALFCIALKLISRLKQLKNPEAVGLNPTPFYFIIIPIAVLVLHLTLATPVTNSSRNRAIKSSAEIIGDIEGYLARHGRYPVFLAGTWKDYSPSVIGVEKFHYAPRGDAYNLFFEQPRFLFDRIGTREFVVFNRRDKHLIMSHTAWILRAPPDELDTAQGWYEAQDTSIPHWKSFLFD